MGPARGGGSLRRVAVLAGGQRLLARDETSEENAASFRPSLFINVYAIIAAVSVVLVTARAFLVAVIGLQTADKFFKQILNSILHAPMSFFDTTPSGRILSRVRHRDTLLCLICLLLFMQYLSV